MILQVKDACIKKENTLTYNEFLHQLKDENKNIEEYLKNINLLHEGHIQEVLPPQEYFKAINGQNSLLNIKEKYSPVKEAKIFHNDELSLRFSPDFDEDTTPTIQELNIDVKKVKEKYEREVSLALTKISKLDETKKKNFQEFTINKSFGSQCPIF